MITNEKYDENLANKLASLPSECGMPDCHEPAVRLGIYEQDNSTEYRQLCERHKQVGMWNKNGGWDNDDF